MLSHITLRAPDRYESRCFVAFSAGRSATPYVAATPTDCHPKPPHYQAESFRHGGQAPGKRMIFMTSLVTALQVLHRSARFGLGVCALIVVVQCLAASAMAQTTESPPQTAVEHYNRGREHYQAGRYREALVELETALTTDPRSPNLVYNVARVHELLGQLDAASQFYQRYRDMLPQAEHEERERVDAILLRLQGAQEHVGPIAAPPKEVLRPPEPMRMKRGVADAAFWTMATMGASALVAAAATGALALKEEKDARDFVVGADGTAQELSKSYRRADRLALSSDATLVIGTTFAVTSILLYMLRVQAVPVEGPAEKTASFSLGASTKGVMLTIGASL